MQILPNIHQINLGYVNVYLIIEEDGLTLIDAGLRSHIKQLVKAIRELGHEPEEIKAVLLTHADPDHIGTINLLHEYTDFKLYASQIEADALKQGKGSRELNIGPILGFFIRAVEFMSDDPEPVIVDEIIKEGDTLPMLKGVQVVASPGHTPGHLSFYFPVHKFLAAGDSLRANKKGLNAGNIKMLTWDSEQLFASITKQSQLGAEIVAVGHGPVTFNVISDNFPTS